MKTFLILLCIVMGGVGCRSSKHAGQLSGVKWVLETLNGEQVKLTVPDNHIFIEFNEAEKRVNGQGGCNRFFGNYEQEGSKLKFSPMGATRMACPDLKTEGRFFGMLDEVDAYRIQDEQLTFLSKDKPVATFRKAEENKVNKE